MASVGCHDGLPNADAAWHRPRRGHRFGQGNPLVDLIEEEGDEQRSTDSTEGLHQYQKSKFIAQYPIPRDRVQVALVANVKASIRFGIGTRRLNAKSAYLRASSAAVCALDERSGKRRRLRRLVRSLTNSKTRRRIMPGMNWRKS